MSDMSGGGGKGPPLTLASTTPATQSPGQLTNSPEWAGTGAPGGTTPNSRSFTQIIEDEKANRNILEITLTKITTTDSAGNVLKGPSLNFDDLGELIFDVLKINHEHCLTFDYNTGRYDTKQIKLKHNINTDNYVTLSPITYKEHMITVSKQQHDITRVTFKNVPLNVPDEEIIHLCKSYGEPTDFIVHYEVLSNLKNKGMTGSTRYVDMKLSKGAMFENYYWLEGPLPGDKGRRVLVLHNGQVAQCSHCLRRSNSGCQGAGNGKVCWELKTPRAKLANYIQHLKIKLGYTSLKTRYLENLAKHFPSLNRAENLENQIEDKLENDDDIIPMNPIELKDKEIASLTVNLEKSIAKELALNNLKEDLKKTTAELNLMKKNFNTSQQKLSFARKATETLLVENIANPDGYREEPALVGVFSATFNEDDFDIDEENSEIRSRKGPFLQSMEEKLDLTSSDQKERYMEVKNQILEKIKTTKVSRIRSRSGSILSQVRKRSHSGGQDKDERAVSRPRTSLLPVKTE